MLRPDMWRRDMWRPEMWRPELRRTLALLGPLAEDGLAQLRAEWREHRLTLLGIVWGSAAVVLLLSLGAGFHRGLDLGFKKTGDRYLLAYGQYTTSEMGGARPGRPIVLDRADLERVRASVPAARYVAGEFQRGAAAARTAYRTRTAIVSAASPDLQFIKRHRIARGRFFDEDDERDARSVVVLGANLPEVFFGSEDPLGGTIQVEGHPFRVIGVLAKKGAQYMTNNGLHDDMIFMPLSRGQRLFEQRDRIGMLLVDPWRLDEHAALRAELEAALLPVHRVEPGDEEAIHFMAVPEITRPFLMLGVGMELLLGFIGTVVLAMAGVGVANLMVALVSRRRVELAMRRACGARRSDLSLQLLVETLLVVLAGGALGVGLGGGTVYAISLMPLPSIVPGPVLMPGVLLTAFAVLVGVGVLAALLPARIASRADPAAALRVT